MYQVKAFKLLHDREQIDFSCDQVSSIELSPLTSHRCFACLTGN